MNRIEAKFPMKRSITRNETIHKSSIEKVNSICLFEIFKQIKIKCEARKPESKVNSIKYADLIQFVVSFEWTINQFSYWDKGLYDLLQIDETAREVDDLTIDFDQIYKGLNRSPKRDQDIFFELWIKNINEQTNLRTVSMIYHGNTYYENHLDIFDKTIKALQNKPLLENLIMQITGYTLENAPHFRNLVALSLNLKINANILVKCCELNPNLRKLSILSNDIYGRLSDITLDTNTKRNLEELDFLIKAQVDAAEYAALAKLDNLKTLTLRGVHEIGTLRHLFHRLSERNFLRSLNVTDATMNDEEAQAISMIQSIEKLDCGFIEAESIGHLSEVRKLKELKITTKHKLSKIFSAISKILKATNAKDVSISYHLDSLKYIKFDNKITWTIFPQGSEVDDYYNFCDVPELRNLSLKLSFDEPYPNKEEMAPLVGNVFRGLSKIPETVQHLKIISEWISCGLGFREISDIATIKSLKSLESNFSDLNDIYVLGQLPQLEKLILKVQTTLKKEAAEGVKKLFKVLALSPFQTLRSLEVASLPFDLSLTEELVKIKSLKYLKCGFSEDECIKYLDILTNLEDLVVWSKHEFNNISDAILCIRSSLKINSKNAQINITRCDNEIDMQVTQKIRIMLTEEKGVDSTSIILGSLKNCHSFFLSGSRNISSLIRAISLGQNNNLRVLNFDYYPINFEESLLISQIHSLERLFCNFADSRSFELIYPQTSLKQIKIDKFEFSSQIFGFLNNSNGKVSINSSYRDITYFKSQGKLILASSSSKIFDTSDYTCLANLDNLQILHIIFYYKADSIKYNTPFRLRYSLGYDEGFFMNLFRNLSSNPKLKELIIEERYSKEFEEDKENEEHFEKPLNTLSLEGILEIRKIKSLTKLKCGFFSAQNIETVAQLNELKDLYITSHKDGSLKGLLQRICSKTTPTLQFLSIDKEITRDELNAIASIRTLKRLEFVFPSDEHEDNESALPELPYLTDLCIRSHRKGTLSSKLRLFLNSPLQNLTIKGDQLDDKDVIALSQHNSLNQTAFALSLLNNIHQHATKLPQSIRIYHPNLCKLMIGNVIIGNQQIIDILQLPALKSLDCILDIDESVNLHRIEKLEELIVTPMADSLKVILQALVVKSLIALKHFVINEVYVDIEEAFLLSQIISLTTLQCKFDKCKPLYYLAQLVNLETLKIISMHDSRSIWTALLNIATNCTNLEVMQLNCSDIIIKGDILYKALISVRDPMRHNPLKLVLDLGASSISSRDWPYLTMCNNTSEFT